MLWLLHHILLLNRSCVFSERYSLGARGSLEVVRSWRSLEVAVVMDLLHRCHLEYAVIALGARAVLVSLLLLVLLDLGLNLLEARVIVNRIERVRELAICSMHSRVSLGTDLVACDVICFQIVSALSVNRMTHSLVDVLIWTLLLLSVVDRSQTLLRLHWG